MGQHIVFLFLHIFQNFPCTLGEKSKSVSFSRVYVYVKAKLTRVSFFLLFFILHLPLNKCFIMIGSLGNRGTDFILSSFLHPSLGLPGCTMHKQVLGIGWWWQRTHWQMWGGPFLSGPGPLYDLFVYSAGEDATNVMMMETQPLIVSMLEHSTWRESTEICNYHIN